MSAGLLDDPTRAFEVIKQFTDVRHMTLAGLTILAYDIPLTLEDELKVVWSSHPWSLSSVFYAFYRYFTLAGGAFVLAFMIPLWNYSKEWVKSIYLDQYLKLRRLVVLRCMRSGIASISLTAIGETVGNAIVLNELIKLWACSRNMSRMMIAGFVLVHSGTMVTTVIAITQLKDGFSLLQADPFRMCVSKAEPVAFKTIFIPSVILQLYWAFLLFLNAVSRPRSSSQKLLTILWSDGLIFFIAMFGLRVLSLLIAVAAPTPIAVLGVAMPILLVNAVVCRLYLWLNGPKGLLLRRILLAYGNEEGGWSDETELQVQLKSDGSVGHMSF